jgi:hypothetical protein
LTSGVGKGVGLDLPSAISFSICLRIASSFFSSSHLFDQSVDLLLALYLGKDLLAHLQNRFENRLDRFGFHLSAGFLVCPQLTLIPWNGRRVSCYLFRLGGGIGRWNQEITAPHTDGMKGGCSPQNNGY